MRFEQYGAVLRGVWLGLKRLAAVIRSTRAATTRSVRLSFEI